MEYIYELSELELYNSLDSLLTMEKRKIVETLNLTALATAAGRGQRKAVNKLKDISKEADREEHQPTSGHGRMSAPLLTEGELKAMAGVVKKENGRKRNS